MIEIEDAINVNHDDLVEHLAKLKSQSDDIKSRGGEMRKFSGQFNDDHGYNQIAKGMLMRLNNMTEEKREDCLRTLIPGLESMVPAWLGQSTPDMFDDAAPEAIPEADTSDVGGNVVGFGDFEGETDPEQEEFDRAVDDAIAGAE